MLSNYIHFQIDYEFYRKICYSVAFVFKRRKFSEYKDKLVKFNYQNAPSQIFWLRNNRNIKQWEFLYINAIYLWSR
jgi:hypothetical protein